MTKPTPKPIRPKKHKAFPACGTESKVRRGKMTDRESLIAGILVGKLVLEIRMYERLIFHPESDAKFCDGTINGLKRAIHIIETLYKLSHKGGKR